MKTSIQTHNNVVKCQMSDLAKDVYSVDEQLIDIKDECQSSCLSPAVNPKV